MAQRYYWLKMKKDFAKDKRIKKLKRIPGGLNFAFIYLEMILNAVDTDGILIYEGVEDTPAKEFALELDEDPDSVQITMSYLLSVGLMSDLGDGRFLLPYAAENLGSEGASAKRMRDLRERQRALQCVTTVSQSDAEAPQCDTVVTEALQIGDVETETETDIETDIETDRLRRQGCLSENKNIPSLEEITQYAVENHMRIDPVKFYKKNQERGWITKKGEPVKNWKRLMWSWNDKEDPEREKQPDKNSFMQNTYDFDQLEKDLVKN